MKGYMHFSHVSRVHSGEGSMTITNISDLDGGKEGDILEVYFDVSAGTHMREVLVFSTNVCSDFNRDARGLEGDPITAGCKATARNIQILQLDVGNAVVNVGFNECCFDFYSAMDVRNGEGLESPFKKDSIALWHTVETIGSDGSVEAWVNSLQELMLEKAQLMPRMKYLSLNFGFERVL